MKIYGIITLIALLLLSGTAIYASDVSDAKYTQTIQLDNAGADAITNGVAVFDLSTSDMISGLMLAATADDCAMLTGTGGSDIKFMPSSNSTNPWCTFVSSLGANSNLYQYLYSKDVTGGEIAYFPGDGGMTISDNTTIEPSDNFTIELNDAWINTDNNTDKYLFDHYDSTNGGIRTFVSPTDSENVTARISSGASGWTSPTGGGGTNWNNEANAYDGDTGTFADHAANPGGYIDYYTATVATKFTNTVRLWYWRPGGGTYTNVQIDIFYSGGWHNIYDGVSVPAAWHTIDLGRIFTVSQVRWRGECDAGAAFQCQLHEIELQVVVIDVTATGVATGEHDVTVALATPFFGLAIDTTLSDILPPAAGLEMNLPLWQTDCSSSPFDSIDSNAYTATVTNAIWTNQGYDFDGVGDWIALPNNTPNAPDEGTFVFWVKFDRDDAAEYIYSQNLRELAIYHTSSDSLRLYYDSLGISFDLTPGYVGNWVHFAFTFKKSGAAKGYENGVEQISAACSAVAPTAGVTKVGAYSTEAPLLKGVIGELLYYDAQLTEDEINQHMNATKKKYTSGDVVIYSTPVTVPDSTADWIVGADDVTPYIGEFIIEKDGAEACNISWEYSETVFQDASVNSNDATPTFRTSASDGDLTATVMSTSSSVTTDNPSTAVTGGWDMIEDEVTAPDDLFTEGASTFPLGSEVAGTAADLGQDETTWLFAFAFFLAIGAFIGIYAVTHNTRMGQRGSMVLASIAAEAVLIYFYRVETVPGWVLIPFGLLALLFVVWRSAKAPVD